MKLRKYLLALVFLSSHLMISCQQESQGLSMGELNEFAVSYATAWSSQDPERLASHYAENGFLQINDGDPILKSLGRYDEAEYQRQLDTVQ